jgi:hypothetical protein
MKKDLKEKVCIICNEKFPPDPRVGDDQTVCDKLHCKLQRKKRAQTNWLAENPGYFKGRYPQLKDQILANNKRKAQARSQACSSIQDELTSNHNKLLTTLECIMSIQDEITHKITESKNYLINCLNLVYKTS